MNSNIEHLYQNLPSRYRREDTELFLKRYLSFIGTTLDEWDEKFDSFFENIDPETAEEIWIKFWLEKFFGWSWFPSWFTLEQKRNLYQNFARHLARRGTAVGIEEWLKDFNIIARVHTRPAFVGEWAWGDGFIAVSAPLVIPIEILEAIPNESADICAIGDGAVGEQFYSENVPIYTQKEFTDLLIYVQPFAQEFLLIQRRNWNESNGNENYLIGRT